MQLVLIDLLRYLPINYLQQRSTPSFFFFFSSFFSVYSVTSIPCIERHSIFISTVFFFSLPTFEKFTEFHPQSDRRREMYDRSLRLHTLLHRRRCLLLFKSTDWHTSIPGEVVIVVSGAFPLAHYDISLAIIAYRTPAIRTTF